MPSIGTVSFDMRFEGALYNVVGRHVAYLIYHFDVLYVTRYGPDGEVGGMAIPDDELLGVLEEATMNWRRYDEDHH